MKQIVVDASVAAKWFLPEADADRARLLLSGRFVLSAPELLWTEVASVVWKYARRGTLTKADASLIVSQSLAFPVELHPCVPLLGEAMTLALEHDRTVYESLYLALAARDSATLVTDDARLARSLTGTRLARRVMLLADLK